MIPSAVAPHVFPIRIRSVRETAIREKKKSKKNWDLKFVSRVNFDETYKNRYLSNIFYEHVECAECGYSVSV